MRYRGLVAFLLVAAIVVTATSVSALDGTRKGFILGFGVGPSVTSWSLEFEASLGPFSESAKSDTESNFGIGTDFKIGGGITEKFLLYYVNRISWFGFDWTVFEVSGGTDITQSITFAYGVGLLGASYYFNVDAPSMYLVGTVGISTWTAPFEDWWDEYWIGAGVSAGLGYEFAKHWSVEGTVNIGKPSYELFPGVELSTNAVAFMVTVGGMLY